MDTYYCSHGKKIRYGLSGSNWYDRKFVRYDKTKHTNSKILIENSAGEGTALYL